MTESPALHFIFQSLSQLTQQMHECTDPTKRQALLRQVRLLLSDADKIIGSEMGDE